MKVNCPVLAVLAVALWGALVGATVVTNEPGVKNAADQYLAANK